MKNNSEILTKAKNFVEEFLNEKLPAGYLYHNFNHAMDAYNNSEEISESVGLPSEENEVLLLAAIFHDTVFVFKYDGHEEEGVKIAEDFLQKEKYPAEKISRISKLILSSKKENEPENISEEILHDADIAHMGKKGFFKKGELLRLELEKVNGISLPDMEWEKEQLDFLSSNKVYTSYAKENFENRLAKNISKQRENISRNKKNHHHYIAYLSSRIGVPNYELS